MKVELCNEEKYKLSYSTLRPENLIMIFKFIFDKALDEIKKEDSR